MVRWSTRAAWWAILGTLAACSTATVDVAPVAPPAPVTAPPLATPSPPAVIPPSASQSLPPPRLQPRSRWVAVPWSELPGLQNDALFDAWNAWLRSCERPAPAWTALCGQVRVLSIAPDSERMAWMQANLQPYRVEPLTGANESLLTGYYEPLLEARRVAAPGYAAPLYRPPADLATRKPWYTRQEIDTPGAAQAALRGREIAWLADPLDALAVQIQGSARLRVTEPDGTRRLVRVSFAGSNDQPYRSVGGWLLQQGALRDASWPGIKAWARDNPRRVNEMLWSNPRYVFFREEALPDAAAADGPRGAQGVPLTAGRSIAVDPQSIPYGTPVWLASPGPLLALNRLVLAQDTGSAIVGAVRADYFAGTGAEAGELAGRLKQPLQMWALWPR